MTKKKPVKRRRKRKARKGKAIKAFSDFFAATSPKWIDNHDDICREMRRVLGIKP